MTKSSKFTLLVLISYLVIAGGVPVYHGKIGMDKVKELKVSFQNGEKCSEVLETFDCELSLMKDALHSYAEALSLQELLVEITKKKIERFQDRSEQIKNKYYLSVSELYREELSYKYSGLVLEPLKRAAKNTSIRMANVFLKNLNDRVLNISDGSEKTDLMNSSNQLAELIKSLS